MTIKLELPQNDPLVLQEMGLALTRIAAALQGGKTTTSIGTTVKAGDLSHTVKETIINSDNIASEVSKGFTKVLQNEDQNTTETFTESGPFYWVEKASCTCGQVNTLDELNAINADRCTYDEFLKYDEDFNGTDTPSTAAATFGGNADNLDDDGIPWDKRIHSQGKTKSKGGTFNLRKKPATYETKEQWTAYVEEVKQELRGVMSAPVTETVTPPPIVEETVTPPVITETVTPPPIVETPPLTETVTPPPADDDVKTFQQLMLLITKNNKKIDKDQVLEILKRHGVTAVPLLATRTDLIPQVATDIKALING